MIYSNLNCLLFSPHLPIHLIYIFCFSLLPNPACDHATSGTPLPLCILLHGSPRHLRNKFFYFFRLLLIHMLYILLYLLCHNLLHFSGLNICKNLYFFYFSYLAHHPRLLIFYLILIIHLCLRRFLITHPFLKMSQLMIRIYFHILYFYYS